MQKIQHKGGTPVEGLEDQTRKFAPQGFTYSSRCNLFYYKLLIFLYFLSVTSYFPNVCYSYLIVCNSMYLGTYFDFFIDWFKSNGFLLNETKTQNIWFNLKQIDTTNLQIDYKYQDDEVPWYIPCLKYQEWFFPKAPNSMFWNWVCNTVESRNLIVQHFLD